MNKWIWSAFGFFLLVMCIISFTTFVSISCEMSHDYGAYLFCKRFSSGYLIKAIFLFAGSMTCFWKSRWGVEKEDK